jgi:hypothetical protein
MTRAKRLSLGGALAAVTVAVIAVGTGSGNAAEQVAPSPKTPPTISGTPEEGKTLTATSGTWDGSTPFTFTYQWRRCDADGSSCSDISAADERSYRLRKVDVGNTLRVRVTAKNNDGSSSSTSVPTALIRSAPAPTPPPPPAPASGCSANAPLQVSRIAMPDRLTVDGQSITPAPVGRSVDSVTVRFHVSCKGKSVQGALVYVTATPYNQFSIPNEATTGSDGWAELRLNRLGGYPATPRQQLLVMFVRARKPGENPLGGISTRRLVSFTVNLSR